MFAVQCKDRAKADTLTQLTSEIASLTSSSEVTVQHPGATAPAGCAPAVIDDSTTAQLLLAGILDPQKEIEKLQKEKVMFTQSYQHVGCHLRLEDHSDLRVSETQLTLDLS